MADFQSIQHAIYKGLCCAAKHWGVGTMGLVNCFMVPCSTLVLHEEVKDSYLVEALRLGEVERAARNLHINNEHAYEHVLPVQMKRKTYKVYGASTHSRHPANAPDKLRGAHERLVSSGSSGRWLAHPWQLAQKLGVFCY